MEEVKISGIWTIGKVEYKGELYIIKKKKIIRLVLQTKEVNAFFEDEEFPNKIDLINGITFLNKIDISLLNCRTLRKNTNLNTGITTYLIDCRYCIYGLKFKNYDNVLFNKLQIRLTNTLEWSTLSGFSSKRNKKIIENISYSFKKKVNYDINENIRLEIVPCFGGGTFYLNSERIVLKQHINIYFICKRQEKFNVIIKELEKLIALIEFSTKQKVNIIEIKGYKNSKFYKYTDIKRRRYIDYRIYFSKEVEENYDNDEIDRRYLILNCNLKQICDVNGLKNWYKKYEKLRPIVNLYRKNIANYENYDEIPIEEVFINLMKALEIYHTIFVVDKLDEYNNLITTKLQSALPENKKLIKEFIYDDIQIKEDYILLKNRLLHLFMESLPISYFENFSNILNFINSITDTRHYYTHYSRSKKYKALKGFELSISNIILQDLLESYILKEIGFQNEYIQNHRKNSFVNLKKVEIPVKEEQYIEQYKKINLCTSIENILRIVINEYNLGEYFNYNIETGHDTNDLYVLVKTKESRSYIIRLLSEHKTEECCNEIISKDKRNLICTKKNYYTVYYFYGKYRILIYKNK